MKNFSFTSNKYFQENHYIIIAVVIPIALCIFNMIMYTLPTTNSVFRKHIEK